MKPDELTRRCADAINYCTRHGEPAASATVLLVVPRGWTPGKGFPRGKTAAVRDDGSRVAYFPALRVVEWLAKTGAVRVEEETAQSRSTE